MPIVKPDLRYIDIWKLVRFSVVGVVVAMIYSALYLTLRAQFGLVEVAASLIAFGAAIVFQYVAQTLWTFRSELRQPKQVGRFALTILAGAIVSSAITGWVGPTIELSDLHVTLIVVVWLPIQNFILFSIWVYNTKIS